MANKHRRPPLSNPNVQGLLVLGVVLALGAVFLLSNRSPQQNVARPAPPPTATAAQLQDWQIALQEQLASLPSATPSPIIPPTAFVAPTLPLVAQAQVTVFQPQAIVSSPVPSLTPLPPEFITATPAVAGPTPVPLPTGLDSLTGIEIGLAPDFSQSTEKFQLPPEQIPLSAHPFDHYYLTRPIDVTANSEYLFYYPYGSGGAGWRVHHGLDMPNPVGEEVRAAGGGTIVWADQTFETEIDGDLEVYAAYGNVVVIEHDFGWRGQPVWTLYAHLSQILVEAGEEVETGDILGLVGTTGSVTGPHVHFEVRLGRNSYHSTRNPMLWMAPYVGHGVVAGRVLGADGEYIDNVLVQLNRGGRITDRTTTYIDPFTSATRVWAVVPDENWAENFAMGDIPEGEYQLVVVVDDERIFQNITVNAGVTTFVEIRLDDAATPFPVTPTAIFPTERPTGIPAATTDPDGS